MQRLVCLLDAPSDPISQLASPVDDDDDDVGARDDGLIGPVLCVRGRPNKCLIVPTGRPESS